jgi:serine/threonine protein kinase
LSTRFVRWVESRRPRGVSIVLSTSLEEVNKRELTLVDQMKSEIWRQRICPDYELDGEVKQGAYGMVFFANAVSEHQTLQSIALKTLIPKNLERPTSSVKELQREIEKWMLLPGHMNILGNRGFKTLKLVLPALSDKEIGKSVQIPIIEMEKMDGSLRDWIELERFSTRDRLIVITQVFNGLAHLYKNGLEGHGDLKPENLFYTDQTPKLADFNKEKYRSYCPYIIKIADFGLADAWIDTGATNMAWRKYMAPERLGENNKFVPEKSDMFAMGIIAAEITQRRHPSRNLKQATKSDGKWIRAAAKGDWDLSSIQSETMKELILNCLNMDPRRRPTAQEAIHTVCEELKASAFY